MKYALLIYQDPKRPFASTDEASQRKVNEAFERLLASPNVGAAIRLQDAHAATTVRFEDGKRLLTDGPYVESKEFLAGAILIEVDNLDQALEAAAALQEYRPGGSIEVRPVRLIGDV